MSEQPSTEHIRHMAGELRLQVNDDEMSVLEQVIRANEEFVASVDNSMRSPSEDPLDFMRFVRSWSVSNGR